MANSVKDGSLDMNALIKASREQHGDRQNKPSQTRKPPGEASTRQPVKVINNASDMANVEHGEYVQTSDGMGAIVVDHEKQLQKLQSNDETSKALLALMDSSGLVSDANEYHPDYGENAPEGYDPGEQWISENPFDPKTKKLVTIKKEFSDLTFGINGLVDANSDEGRAVNEALEKLRSGEVVLPTPEEYELQKQQAKERRKQRQERLANQATESKQPKESENSKDNSIPMASPTLAPKEEPKMAEMPEHAIMRKGVIEQMSELVTTTEQTTPVATAPEIHDDERVPILRTPLTTGEPKRDVPKLVVPGTEIEARPYVPEVKTPEEVGLNQEPTVETPAPEAEPPKASEPIDLGAMEEELAEAKENPPAPTEQAPAEKRDPNAPDVVINVPEGEADKLFQTMPLDTYDKVTHAKSIVVNEIEKKDVPTATRRITNIAEYRALNQRRKNKRDAEITERVLLNSGIVITLKSATSLEMSTIFKTMQDTDIDWAKEYTFIYEHHVDTSVGRLSYNDFVKAISPSDIETCLDGIYEISETDTRKIQLTCGTRDGGCGSPYEVEVDVSTLPCVDRLSDRSKARVKEIITARNNPEEAKKIYENSPNMTAKYVEMGDRLLVIRNTTGHMLIERSDYIDAISDQYNGLIALLILYIEQIQITVQIREDAEPDIYYLDSIDAICEELKTLTDEEMEELRQIIESGLTDYDPVTYSLKGEFKCPNCGKVEREVPCNISDLIFQKVQRMLG